MERIVTLIIGVLVGFSILYYLSKQRKIKIESEVVVDELNLETVVNWFNKVENRKYLSEDQDNKAVLLRDKELKRILKQDISSYANNMVFQCIFNTKNDKIIKGRLIKFKTIDKEIEKMFRDKSMLIFQ